LIEPVRAAPPWSPWRAVVWFGLISLFADMVYEGARSVAGPLLGSLGASALAVGLITGAGEGTALVFRLISGRWADRTGRYWTLTMVGYGLTAVCVPLLAITPFVGALGLSLAAFLIVSERLGKAIRSPSKSALLAHAAGNVGRGRGFGVHKALDQVGAFAGPLLVAGLIAAFGHTWLALATLALPGAVALGLLVWVRIRVPDMSVYDETPALVVTTAELPVSHGPLPRPFYLFAVACSASTLGLMTFGVIGYHLVSTQLVSAATVPLIYAGAMAVGAATALLVGAAYDRIGGRVLLGLPILVAGIPLLALSSQLGVVLAGIGVWAMATGVQDSTVKALVADLVPAGRRATAYGVFAAFQGVAALVGGALAGWLYVGGVADLVVVVGVAQLAAFVLFAKVTR
jgi:MFS family permease